MNCYKNFFLYLFINIPNEIAFIIPIKSKNLIKILTYLGQYCTRKRSEMIK